MKSSQAKGRQSATRAGRPKAAAAKGARSGLRSGAAQEAQPEAAVAARAPRRRDPDGPSVRRSLRGLWIVFAGLLVVDAALLLLLIVRQ